MTTRSNPIGDMIWKDLVNRTNSLKQMFAEVETEHIHSIPEDIFVNMFLPLFSGELTTNTTELLKQWYTLAGTPYAAVNVIDAKGNVVATVPPIKNRDILPISSKRDERHSLETTFEIAKQKASLSPNLAQNIVINELNNRFLTKVNVNTNNSITEQWTALLKHYGKNLMPDSKVISNTTIGESDFEYE